MGLSRYGKMEDTAEALFTKRFLCKYPLVQSMDVDEIKEYGIYSTGDKRLDKMVIPSMTTEGMITIDRMVELYRQSCPIYICKREDTKTVYELIQKHLGAWLNHLERGINVQNAPIEDLILLDEFAETLFAYVRHEYAKTNYKNEIHERLLRLNPFSPMALLNKKPVKEKSNKTVDQDGTVTIGKKPSLPKRGSFADKFKENLILLKEGF